MASIYYVHHNYVKVCDQEKLETEALISTKAKKSVHKLKALISAEAKRFS